MNKKGLFWLMGLVVLGVLGRIVPHVPNMTPMVGIGLVVARYWGWKRSLGVVWISMIVSDWVIGGYTWQIMGTVYGSLGLTAVIGGLARRAKGWEEMVALSVVSSALFFVFTNGAVWLFGSAYEHSWAGLMSCYAMGLPFWRNMVVGDVMWTVGLWWVVERSWAVGRLGGGVLVYNRG